MEQKLSHLSLFSGCGGMDLGVVGGFKVHKSFVGNNTTNLFTKLPHSNFQTVFANDIKKDAQSFWMKNFPQTEKNFVLGSIVDLVKDHEKNGNVFPKNIDLLTGGFPCQDFSVSGLRKGFNSSKSHLNDTNIQNSSETRGKLYLWMKKVIEFTSPKIFIAENVKGLANLGSVLQIIKKDFANTSPGYEIFSRELFAPNFGIPQSRRRIFIIGVNKNFIESNQLELFDDDLFPDIEFTTQNTDTTLPHTPPAKHFFDGLLQPQETKDLSQKSYSKAKYTPNSQGQIEINENALAPTIRSEHHGNIEFRFLSPELGGKNIKSDTDYQRRLTVRECARIQTFPDELEFVFKTSENCKLSASAAYKLIGDAVPPLLSYKIVHKLEKLLLKYP